MKNKLQTIVIVVAMLSASVTTMAQKYHVTKIERTRITVDNRYADDKEAAEYLAPYKHKVDSLMSPVVGETARYMKSYYPESELSNLLADIMVWCGTMYNEKPDLGFYNLGGIRASLPEGKVTFGDVLDVAPFENKICFITLTGEQLTRLCQQMCKGMGAGISHGLCIHMKNHELLWAKVNGEDIVADKKYRVATLDFLLQGNDNLMELKYGTEINSPQDEHSNTRYLIVEYFKQKMAKGEKVDSQIEGRFVIE